LFISRKQVLPNGMQRIYFSLGSMCTGDEIDITKVKKSVAKKDAANYEPWENHIRVKNIKNYSQIIDVGNDYVYSDNMSK